MVRDKDNIQVETFGSNVYQVYMYGYEVGEEEEKEREKEKEKG